MALIFLLIKLFGDFGDMPYDTYLFMLYLAIDLNTGTHLLRWFWRWLIERWK